jgi:hypothetical protein
MGKKSEMAIAANNSAPRGDDNSTAPTDEKYQYPRFKTVLFVVAAVLPTMLLVSLVGTLE